MAAEFFPSPEQVAMLKKKGIDWTVLQKIAELLKEYGPAVLNIILVLLGGKPPAPTGKMATGRDMGALLKKMKANCPCPDAADGDACCHCCMQYILMAGLCCEGHCCQDDCDTYACCQETMGFLLKALECCASHCCYSD